MTAPSTSAAHALHKAVGPERWCVTRRDVKSFRKLICEALRANDIHPTDRDKFDCADRTCGPNMYTVVEQFIKPTTHSAGDMSWALMLHPEGLKCDVFVTHAWQEGIFEFIDCLLNGWHFWRKHAWICALAVPQNLDIAALISVPSESPFSKALHCATEVIVVPNSKTSVYTRIWCVYEAFLAYEDDKVMSVAHAPYIADVAHSVAPPMIIYAIICAFAMAIGRIEGSIKQLLLGQHLLAMCIGFAGLAGIMTFFVDHRRWKVYNRLFVFGLCGRLAVATFLDFPHEQALVEMMACNNPQFPLRALGFCNDLYWFSIFIVMEFDRIRFALYDKATEQIKKDYTGSVLEAESANQLDKRNILAAIGEQHQAVDTTIATLVSAGMSSKSLRTIRQLNIHMSDVGKFRLAPVFAISGGWVVLNIFSLCSCEWNPDRVGSLVIVLLLALCACVFISRPIDQKALMNTTALTASIPLVVLEVLYHINQQRLWSNAVTYGCFGSWLFVSCMAGLVTPDALAKLPFCGPWLVRLFLADSSCGINMGSICKWCKLQAGRKDERHVKAAVAVDADEDNLVEP